MNLSPPPLQDPLHLFVAPFFLFLITLLCPSKLSLWLSFLSLFFHIFDQTENSQLRLSRRNVKKKCALSCTSCEAEGRFTAYEMHMRTTSRYRQKSKDMPVQHLTIVACRLSKNSPEVRKIHPWCSFLAGLFRYCALKHTHGAWNETHFDVTKSKVIAPIC